MKTVIPFLLLFATLLVASTQNPSQINFEGLWLVEKVSVGSEEMTPSAKWVRINPNGTQQAGNGWLQHTTGDWKYDQSNHLLSFLNENGMKDSYPPFSIQVRDDVMTWKRKEDDYDVEVKLKKIEDLPISEANNLLGIWKPVQTPQSNNLKEYDKASRSLFIRWDNRYSFHNKADRVEGGIYQVHGHRPILTLLHQEEGKWSSIRYTFSISGNELTLKSGKDNSSIVYKRIHDFNH